MDKLDISALEDMISSGRGISLLTLPNEDILVVQTLTGRSPSSQARVYDSRENAFVVGDDQKKDISIIRTDVINPKELETGSPALLLYESMIGFDGRIIASNGAQTKLIFSYIHQNPNCSINYMHAHAYKEPFFEYDKKNNQFIDITTFEPDAPINTPRISLATDGKNASFYIVRKTLSETMEKVLMQVKLQSGNGYLLTTYKGGSEDKLIPGETRAHPFEGNRPLDMVVNTNDVHEILDRFYQAISHGAKPEDNYAVAVAAMVLKKDGTIENYQPINRFTKNLPEVTKEMRMI